MGFITDIDVSESNRTGEKVHIAPGCPTSFHNHRRKACQYIADQGRDIATDVIEDVFWLGAEVFVLPGVTIGRGAIVQAGAVFIRSVVVMSIVAGVPARVVGTRMC